MKIGIPAETLPNEKRVAVTPDSASGLVKSDFKVSVQSGAGTAAGFTDEAYRQAGAAMIPSADDLFREADIILKVQKPDEKDFSRLRAGMIVISLFQPLTHLDLVKQLAERKITSFSMDLIPRITRAQKMDVLSSMSTVAGYKAVLLAANASPRFFPMLMTAAGTIAPAKAFILGAGVAGLQAIATARRLGAVVEAFDTRPVVREQVESLGAKFVEVDMKVDSAAAQDKGGYAKEMSDEFYRKEMELMKQKAAASDVIITTALIPGKPAPRLILEDHVKGMKPGSVIVDLAAENGGNCELTKAGEVISVHGVTIIGTLNLPSLVPYHASQMFSKNISSFLFHLVRDQELVLDWSDEIISSTCVTHDGEIKNQSVKKILEQGAAAR